MRGPDANVFACLWNIGVMKQNYRLPRIDTTLICRTFWGAHTRFEIKVTLKSGKFSFLPGLPKLIPILPILIKEEKATC